MELLSARLVEWSILSLGDLMNKESEFCRRQSERLLTLARATDDLAVRKELTAIASEWLAIAREQAAAKQINDAPDGELPCSVD
jgi:hypothetical protein